MPAPESVATVDEVAEAYVCALAALDPVGATRQGIAGHESEMTDFGPEGVEARAELARRTRRLVQGVEPADHREQIAVDVMVERLTADLDAHDAGEWRRNLNVLFSPLQQIRECFDLMPTGTPEEREALADRMDAVPASLAGLRATLREGLVAGTPVARRQALACAAQASTWCGATNGSLPYFSRLAAAGNGSKEGTKAPAPRPKTTTNPPNTTIAKPGRWL
ncbi:MAG: DUF885 family protein, partial [Acidimicrobiales bacterium]